MEKILYVAERNDLYRGDIRDSFLLKVSFDFSEAERAAIYDRGHLVKRERKNSESHILGYTVDVGEGTSAREAFNDVCDELRDPDYYREVFVAEELTELEGAEED